VAGDLGNAAKGAMQGAITGAKEVGLNATEATTAAASGVLKSTSEILSNSGKAGTSLIDASSGVVRSAIQAVVEVGGDVGSGAKGVVVGILQGTKVGSKEALVTISETSRIVVKGTSDVAGDIAKAAKGAVQGAITGAKEISLDTTEAASAAAMGALKAAEEISSKAAQQVRKAVTGTISGVKVVLKEPFKSKKS
jgi:hypothetical protein